MAYITADQLTLERMSKMDTGEFDLALSDLREAGLTEQGATFLTAYVNPPYQARLLADAAYDTQIAELKKAATALLNSKGVGSYAYLAAKEELDLVIAADAGRRHNEKFKGIAPYLYLWPFPFYEESKRSINGIPLIWGFKLNGEALQSASEYRNYWLNNPAINWPDIPIDNLYADTAYRDRMWGEFLKFAPDYKYFLTAIKYIIGASKVTIGQQYVSYYGRGFNEYGTTGGDVIIPENEGTWKMPRPASYIPPEGRSGEQWGIDKRTSYEWFPLLDPYAGWRGAVLKRLYGSQGEMMASCFFTHHGDPTGGFVDVQLPSTPTRNEPARLHISDYRPTSKYFWIRDSDRGFPDYQGIYGLGFRRAINAPDMPWTRNAAALDKGGQWNAVKDFPEVNPYNPLVGKLSAMAIFGGGYWNNTQNPSGGEIGNSRKWCANPSDFFGTDNAYQYLNSLELLRQSVDREILLRFWQPPPPPPRRRSWFWKILSFIPYVLPFLAPALIPSVLFMQLGAIAAGQIVAKQVGGILGTVLGAVASAGVNWTGGALGIGATPNTVAYDSLGLNAATPTPEMMQLGYTPPVDFIPVPSATAPSYALTSSITSGITSSQPIQKILGAGLDAAMNNYVGIPAAWLNTISTNPLLQASFVAASIAAPQQARIGLGALSLVQNFDKLTPTTLGQFKTEFVPAATLASRIALPQFSKEIRVASTLAGYTPNLAGDWSIPDIGQVIAKIPDYLIEGIEETGKAVVRAPELAVKGLTYTAEHIAEVPQLAVKGVEFVAVKAPPLIIEGFEETGKTVLQSPELLVKGATFVVEKGTPLVVEGVSETLKSAAQQPQLVMQGLQVGAQFTKPSFEMPSMSPQARRPELVFKPVSTVQDGKTVVKEEPVVTSRGVTGEEIIHLQAVPIKDTSLSLTIAGTLAIVALAAMSGKKN